MVPLSQARPGKLASKTRRDMIETCGRLAQLLGLPRSTGQIYGLLYLEIKPLSLDDMVELLSISKGSASTGSRQLISWGVVRQAWVPGDRRDYFEVVVDLANVIQNGYLNFIKPRVEYSGKRINSMLEALKQDYRDGALTQEELEICVERLEQMARIQKRIHHLAPLAEKFFL